MLTITGEPQVTVYKPIGYTPDNEANHGIPEFKPFPKIPRFMRNIIITEKIDGTNALVHVSEDGTVRAGSRNRWLTEKEDNFGFAAWVSDHELELSKLGPGYHYGEWWGHGIQRGYGCKAKVGVHQMPERYFSLFNVTRWHYESMPPACCEIVPILYKGPFQWDKVEECMQELKHWGSQAKDFTDPEGLVIYHEAGNHCYKITCKNDEQRKEMSHGAV